MKVFEIETVGPLPEQTLGKRLLVGASLGSALDFHAPDPREGAVFRVRYVGEASEVLGDFPLEPRLAGP